MRSNSRFCFALAWTLTVVLPSAPVYCLTQDEITSQALSLYNIKSAGFNQNTYLNYYLYGVPPYPRYEGGLLTWQETYLGSAYYSMYLATQNLQFLDLLLSHAEVMYAHRGDRVSPPIFDQIRNRQMPAFVSFNLQEGPDARQHSWLVESAYQTHPVTFAIAQINSDSHLTSLFGARASALMTDIIETMDSFDTEFSMFSGGRGRYHDPYLAFTDPYTNGELPYNMQSAAGQVYIALWKATGQQRFYDRAVALATTLKAELTPLSDRYRWRYAPYDSPGSVSDVSHAGMDVAFIVDAYEAGIVFDDTDIQRLINTMRYIRKDSGFTATVDGSGVGTFDKVRLVSTWLSLIRYDATLRQEMFPLYQSYWSTDCCGWPMMGTAYFYESGRYYSQEVSFHDSFDDLQLSPRWRRPVSQAITNSWVAQTTGSQLVVSDIKTNTTGSWVDIVKTRDVAQDSSWQVVCEFSWDSVHGSSDPLQAMQRFYVELLNSSGTVIASVGINDAWFQENGGRAVQLHGQSITEPSNSLDASGSATIRIVSDAMLGVSEVYWNGARLLSSSIVDNLSQVALRFGFYKHVNNFFQPLSHFGTISVDTLAVTEPGDYNLDGLIDAADYVLWRKTDGSQEAYNVWLARFGSLSGSGSGLSRNSTLVPEPSLAVLVVFTSCVLCCWRVVHPISLAADMLR